MIRMEDVRAGAFEKTLLVEVGRENGDAPLVFAVEGKDLFSFQGDMLSEWKRLAEEALASAASTVAKKEGRAHSPSEFRIGSMDFEGAKHRWRIDASWDDGESGTWCDHVDATCEQTAYVAARIKMTTDGPEGLSSGRAGIEAVEERWKADTIHAAAVEDFTHDQLADLVRYVAKDASSFPEPLASKLRDAATLMEGGPAGRRGTEKQEGRFMVRFASQDADSVDAADMVSTADPAEVGFGLWSDEGTDALEDFLNTALKGKASLFVDYDAVASASGDSAYMDLVDKIAGSLRIAEIGLAGPVANYEVEGLLEDDDSQMATRYDVVGVDDKDCELQFALREVMEDFDPDLSYNLGESDIQMLCSGLAEQKILSIGRTSVHRAVMEALMEEAARSGSLPTDDEALEALVAWNETRIDPIEGVVRRSPSPSM